MGRGPTGFRSFRYHALRVNPSGEGVRDDPHSDNRRGGNRCSVATTSAPLRPQAGSLSGFRPFGADRNIRHFLWYSGVAGEGLRSVGGEAPPLIQERVLYPAHRHLRVGAFRAPAFILSVAAPFRLSHHPVGRGLYNACIVGRVVSHFTTPTTTTRPSLCCNDGWGG